MVVKRNKNKFKKLESGSERNYEIKDQKEVLHGRETLNEVPESQQLFCFGIAETIKSKQPNDTNISV